LERRYPNIYGRRVVAPTTPDGEESWRPTMSLEEAMRVLGHGEDD